MILEDLANLSAEEMKDIYGVDEVLACLLNELIVEANSLRTRVQVLEEKCS
mgnify:CR=1 FL=1